MIFNILTPTFKSTLGLIEEVTWTRIDPCILPLLMSEVRVWVRVRIEGRE